MAKLVEIVNDRNAIVDGLDEDRLRCVRQSVLLLTTGFTSRVYIFFSQMDLGLRFANVM